MDPNLGCGFGELLRYLRPCGDGPAQIQDILDQTRAEFDAAQMDDPNALGDEERIKATFKDMLMNAGETPGNAEIQAQALAAPYAALMSRSGDNAAVQEVIARRFGQTFIEGAQRVELRRRGDDLDLQLDEARRYFTDEAARLKKAERQKTGVLGFLKRQERADAKLTPEEKATRDATAANFDAIRRAVQEATGLDLLEAKNADIRKALDVQGTSLNQDAPPVAVLTGEELGVFQDVADLRNAAIQHYRDQLQGSDAIHPVLGKIRFTGVGRNHVQRYSGDPDKLKMLPALRDMLERGEYTQATSSLRERLKTLEVIRESGLQFAVI